MFLATDLVVNEQYIPDNYSFYTYGKVMDEMVHIFIVESWEDYPIEKCQDKNIRGCAVYGPMIDNYIYLRPQHYTDDFGMTTFEHEVAHIKCQCDFHMTKELREHLEKQDDVLGYIVDNKENIRKYLGSFI